jgi:hypothetical protein
VTLIPRGSRTQAWAGLRLDRDLPNVVRGPGLVYFNVRVIEAKEWFAAEHVAPNPGSAQAKQKKRPSPARRDFTAADRPLTKEMHRMLTAKPPKAKDKQEAASYVVDRAAGDGTVFSKIKRLMKHYSDVYG